MNKNKITRVGIGACAVACVGSLAIPAVLGTGAAAVGSLSLWGGSVNMDTFICATAALLIAGGAFYLGRRTQSGKANCASDGACGCR